MTIFWIFAALAILGLAGYLFQILAVRFFTPPPNSGEGHDLPLDLFPISILKPLKGLDDNLFDNLESFCKQDYPAYEIILSLQDYNDPAFKVAKKIEEKFSERDITVIVERCDEGLNPKVNNLIPACRIAKHEHILISDSNVMVGRAYLKEVARLMNDPSVGLVSSLIRGIGGRTFGAVLENLHMNSFIIGSVCFLDRFLEMPCVIGKSMLMRKSDLDRIGGLRAFKDVLAEDYAIGRKMHEAGKRVVLSPHLINNVNHYWGIRKFLNRHTRWGKLRWKIGGLSYLSELLGNPVFMGFVPTVLWEPSRLTVSFALIVSLLKVLGDYSLGRRIASDVNPFLYFLSPVKDVIIGAIWFIPLFSTTVVWRGNRFTISKDSLLQPYPESGLLAWRYRIVDAIKGRLA